MKKFMTTFMTTRNDHYNNTFGVHNVLKYFMTIFMTTRNEHQNNIFGWSYSLLWLHETNIRNFDAHSFFNFMTTFMTTRNEHWNKLLLDPMSKNKKYKNIEKLIKNTINEGRRDWGLPKYRIQIL